MVFILYLPVQMLYFPLCAQEPDTLRRGIHQFESEQHRWDILKLDSGVTAFSKGKEYAVKMRWQQAENEFLGAVKHNAADAYFNLGMLFYHQDKLDEARMYLQKSLSVKNDSLVTRYLKEIKRRISSQR
jgi:tetratricopeptide (TPR) repeat protein